MLQLKLTLVVRCLCILAPLACIDPQSFVCPAARDCLCSAADGQLACLPDSHFERKRQRCERAIEQAVAARKVTKAGLEASVQRLVDTLPGVTWVSKGETATAPPVEYLTVPPVSYPTPPTTTPRRWLVEKVLQIEGKR